MTPLSKTPGAQAGISMIEVLVTLIILLVGLLGLAGLMVQGQRSEMESYQRVQAMILLQDMAERINANRMASMAPYPAGNCYNISDANGTLFLGIGASAVPTCTPATIAASYNLTTAAPYLPTSTGTAFPVPITPAAAATNPNAATNPAAIAVSDLQAWSFALQGVAESAAGTSSGAMIGARGCIRYDPATELKALDGVTTLYGSGIYTVSVAWQGLGDTSPPPATLTCGKNLYLNNLGAADEALRRVVSLTFRIGTITNTN